MNKMNCWLFMCLILITSSSFTAYSQSPTPTPNAKTSPVANLNHINGVPTTLTVSGTDSTGSDGTFLVKIIDQFGKPYAGQKNIKMYEYGSGTHTITDTSTGHGGAVILEEPVSTGTALIDSGTTPDVLMNAPINGNTDNEVTDSHGQLKDTPLGRNASELEAQAILKRLLDPSFNSITDELDVIHTYTRVVTSDGISHYINYVTHQVITKTATFDPVNVRWNITITVLTSGPYSP